MKLYDNLLTISAGYISVDRELNLGEDVTIEVQGSVIEKKQTDNQDGTYNVTVKVKGAISEVKQQGKVISEEEHTSL
jgi:hypothetical protein